MPPVVPDLFDTTLLEAALTKADSLDITNFRTGWADLVNAIRDGEAALESHESQEEIDEAANMLNAALLGLRLDPETVALPE